MQTVIAAVPVLICPRASPSPPDEVSGQQDLSDHKAFPAAAANGTDRLHRQSADTVFRLPVLPTHRLLHDAQVPCQERLHQIGQKGWLSDHSRSRPCHPASGMLLPYNVMQLSVSHFWLWQLPS